MLNCKFSSLVGDSIHIKHIIINFNNNQGTKLKIQVWIVTKIKRTFCNIAQYFICQILNVGTHNMYWVLKIACICQHSF